MIYSIGYQRVTLAQVLTIMVEKEVRYLVDVRSYPNSRHPSKHEFNRGRLEKGFPAMYRWMGDVLGGKLGPAKEEGIIRLITLHNEPGGHNLMLMCMEHDPCDCHRLYDISRRLLKRGIDVIHLVDGHEHKTSEVTEEVCNDRKRLCSSSETSLLKGSF